MDPKSITKIIGGAGHTFIILESGLVYGCGSNKDGQLALDENIKYVLDFQLINSLEEYFITDIACGWNSTVALTQNNIALVWGNNTHLQLGLSNKLCYYKPNILQYSVKFISMGLRHIGVVTENGLLAMGGSNAKGQLYLFNEDNSPVKKSKLAVVKNFKNVVKVACGQNHTLVLMANGELYGFGDNRYKQICMTVDEPIIYQPQRICFYEHIPRESRILCGWTHNALLTNDGKALLWGRNNYSQLTGTSSGPVVVDDVVLLALGSEHCISICSKNALHTWGWNEHNNCGIPNCDIVSEKSFLANNCLKVGAGYGYSFAVLCS